MVRVYGVCKTEVQSQATINDESADVGTGFFISNDGLVMTVANLVEKATSYWIHHDGVTYNAYLLGYDKFTNIAILKLKYAPRKVPYLSLSENLELPEVSTLLLAITSKMGLEPEPADGMVVAWHQYYFGHVFPTTYLRTNIASYGGDLGSPVFDLKGRFIGMMANSADNIRASFVVPAKAILRIRDDLVFSGKVSYGYLGLLLDNKEQGSRSSTDYAIADALAGGPAAAAGIKVGDALLEFNEKQIKDVSDLHNEVFYARPGQVVTMKVRRGTEEKLITLKVGDEPVAQWEAAFKQVESPLLNNDVQVAKIEKTISEKNSEKDSTEIPEIVTRVSQKRINYWHNHFTRQ